MALLPHIRYIRSCATLQLHTYTLWWLLQHFYVILKDIIFNCSAIYHQLIWGKLCVGVEKRDWIFVYGGPQQPIRWDSNEFILRGWSTVPFTIEPYDHTPIFNIARVKLRGYARLIEMRRMLKANWSSKPTPRSWMDFG